MLTIAQVKKIRRQLGQSERLVDSFAVLGDANRFRIFKLLAQQSDLCVTDVAGILDVSVPAVSQQLRIMELCGLVKKERHGQMVCYCLAKDNEVVRMLSSVITRLEK